MEAIYRGLGHTTGSYFGGMLSQKYGDVSIAFTLVGKSLLSFLCLAGTIGFMSPNNNRKVTH